METRLISAAPCPDILGLLRTGYADRSGLCELPVFRTGNSLGCSTDGPASSAHLMCLGLMPNQLIDRLPGAEHNL